MDILVVLALVIGASVCLIPGIMAWIHYFGGSKQAEKREKTVSASRPVTASHAL